MLDPSALASREIVIRPRPVVSVVPDVVRPAHPADPERLRVVVVVPVDPTAACLVRETTRALGQRPGVERRPHEMSRPAERRRLAQAKRPSLPLLIRALVVGSVAVAAIPLPALPMASEVGEPPWSALGAVPDIARQSTRSEVRCGSARLEFPTIKGGRLLYLVDRASGSESVALFIVAHHRDHRAYRLLCLRSRKTASPADFPVDYCRTATVKTCQVGKRCYG